MHFNRIVWICILCLGIGISVGKAQVRLSGHIQHPTQHSIQFKRFENYLSFEEELFDSARIDAKGNFSIELPIKESTWCDFYIGEQYGTMYLQVGDKLNMELDVQAFDSSLHFSGNSACIQNYLAEKTRKFPNISPQMILALSANKYVILTDSIRKAKKELCNRMLSESSDKCSRFKTIELATIDYEFAYNRNAFPKLQKYYNHLEKMPDLPDNFMAFKNELKLDDPAMLHSLYYLLYVMEETGVQVQKVYAADTSRLFNNVFWDFCKTYSPALSDYLHARRIYEVITFESNYPEAKRLFDRLKIENNTCTYIPALSVYLNDMIRLNPGNPAPNFICTDIQGKKYALSDFAGRPIYIDFWATWCGPCRQETPHLENLIESMNGVSNMAFISISLDDNKDKWKQMVQSEQMKGIQLIVDGNFDSGVAKAYQVKSIPHYVIIDSNGKIVQNNAKRPSSGIREELLRVR